MFSFGSGVKIHLVGDDEDELIVFPADWRLVFDPSGRFLKRNRVLIAPLLKRSISAHQIDDETISFAKDFIGNNRSLHRGIIDVPDGRWDRIGRADTVLYRRRGSYRGPKGHDFEKPVPLYRHCRGRCFELRLPRGAVIGEEGFVWP